MHATNVEQAIFIQCIGKYFCAYLVSIIWPQWIIGAQIIYPLKQITNQKSQVVNQWISSMPKGDKNVMKLAITKISPISDAIFLPVKVLSSIWFLRFILRFVKLTYAYFAHFTNISTCFTKSSFENLKHHFIVFPTRSNGKLLVNYIY